MLLQIQMLTQAAVLIISIPHFAWPMRCSGSGGSLLPSGTSLLLGGASP
jgi:hypothetical protein